MKIYDFPQGSAQWRKARAGIPTASEFAKVIMPKKLELSSEADAYENRLVAERLTGEPIMDFKGTYEMMRGKELEGDAIQFYEMVHGVDCSHAGFMTNDLGTFGGSPDALVGERGGLELKAPGPHTHIGYLLKPDTLYDKYKPQVQGNLFISGREFWDIMSFHPELPPAIKRVYPDEAYHLALSKALDQMEQNILAKIAKIQAMRS